MRSHNYSRSQNKCNENPSASTLLQNPCENIGALISILSSDSEFRTKSLIVDHIFGCEKCYGSYKNYVALSDSISTFSQDTISCMTIPKIINRKRTYTRIHIARLSLISLSLVILLIIATHIFVNNRRLPLTGNYVPHIWRGLSLFAYSELYPFPFSAISRNSLYFKISNYDNSVYWRVFVFDSDLNLFWQSDFSNKRLIIPDKRIVDSLKMNSFYYWIILFSANSSYYNDSDLIPFLITD